MSSYLKIYIVPRGSENRVEIVSYSRSTDIYVAITDVINIPSAYGNTECPELTIEDIGYVTDNLRESIANEDRHIAEYEKHAGGNIEIINEIVSRKEYRESLYGTLKKAEFLLDILTDAKNGFSDVEKVLCVVT